MRSDFLFYENYFTLFSRFGDELDNNIQLWISYRNSFHSAVPLNEATPTSQRMLSIYAVGRDCATNAEQDLNYEDISYYPSVEKFVQKCGYNISYRIEKMKKCLDSVSDISPDTYPHIYANMLNLFHEQLDIFSAILKQIENLEEEIKQHPQRMPINNQKINDKIKTPNINIGTFQGILGDVSNSNITQNLNISKGNIDELKEVLKNNGVSEIDSNELIELLKEEPKRPTPSSFGPKVSEWIGKMVAKAVNGTWAISTSAAGSFLANLIANFYGI